MKSGKQSLIWGAITTALSVLLFAGSAWAQTPGAVGQPGVREERPDPRTPVAKASENYDPIGMPVGSFRLFPVLELNEVYNDNIYAVPTAQGKTGSFIQVIKPSLNLRSDWSQHMLNAFATGGFGLYAVDALNNYYDFGVGGDGRYDIRREWNVYGGASFNRRHEDRGSPNTVTTSTLPPNTYNQIAGNAGYFQAFNRFSVRLDGRVDNYNYLTPGLGPSSGSIFNYDRDRTEFREAARFAYEFSPGYSVWARGGLNQRQYQYNPDTSGFYHNSSGWDAVGGVAIDFGGITSIEAFVGYIQQIYVDTRFTPVQAPTFGLTGYWNPRRDIRINPFVRRTVEESSLNSTSAYLSTAFGVDAHYDMFPNVQADGHADYAIADYNSISGSGAGNRYDQYLTLRATLKYLPTRNFWVGPSYQYVTRNSNQPNSNYDQNIIMLRLGAQL